MLSIHSMAVVVKTVLGSHFGGGGFSCIRQFFRTYFSGDWDVHWGVSGILTYGHMNQPTPVDYLVVPSHPVPWLFGLLGLVGGFHLTL